VLSKKTFKSSIIIAIVEIWNEISYLYTPNQAFLKIIIDICTYMHHYDNVFQDNKVKPNYKVIIINPSCVYNITIEKTSQTNRPFNQLITRTKMYITNLII